jgi:hypothetical protein
VVSGRVKSCQGAQSVASELDTGLGRKLDIEKYLRNMLATMK